MILYYLGDSNDLSVFKLHIALFLDHVLNVVGYVKFHEKAAFYSNSEINKSIRTTALLVHLHCTELHLYKWD